MGLFRAMVAVLTVTLLTFPCGVGAFGAVLCIEADGQAELEEHGCDCTSTHTPDRTAGEDVGAHHVAANLGDESCEPCIDIPIGFGAQFVRVKAPELKSLVFTEAPSSATDHANSSLVLASVSYHRNGRPIDSGSIPLRI